MAAIRESAALLRLACRLAYERYSERGADGERGVSSPDLTGCAISTTVRGVPSASNRPA